MTTTSRGVNWWVIGAAIGTVLIDFGVVVGICVVVEAVIG